MSTGYRSATVCLLLTAVWLWPTACSAAVISRSAEISLGREAAQEYEAKASVDSDPALAARVRRIGQRLIAAAGVTEYPFEFHAVETNSVNAFALPGGFIYLYRGLTQLAPGDDALAFILAHEIAHVTRRHGVKHIEKSLAIGALLDFALGSGTASAILRIVLDMHYSRRDETEADRLGLEMMARAGFDPKQAAEAMAVVARAARSGRSLPPFLRSHPLPETRIAALRQQAAALRVAARLTPDLTGAPPLPGPAALPALPAAVAPSELFPLEVGMRWTYRVAGAGGRNALTTTVLEQHPDRPGVFRLRTELDDDLAASRLVSVAAAGVYVLSRQRAEDGRATNDEGRTTNVRRSTLNAQRSALNARRATPRPPGDWQMEIDLSGSVLEDEGQAPWETVRVPAGEFRALRAVQRSSGGEPVATVWLAPGVGIVRREWQRTGLVEELESFQRPAPEEEQRGS